MYVKKIIIDFIIKHKIETISVFLMALITKNLSSSQNSISCELFAILILISMSSFFYNKLFKNYQYIIDKNIIKKIKIFDSYEKRELFIKFIIYIAVVFISYCLYRFSLIIFLKNNKNILGYSYIVSVLPVASILFLLISYFVIKEKNIKIKNYILNIFINLIFLFLIECVIAIGFFVIMGINYSLFGKNFFEEDIIIIVLSFVFYIGLFVSIENEIKKYNFFIKLLVLYIMQIMVFIGFFIFYIYFFNIIIKKELPSNQVFTVCVTLFSLGLSISLMSLSIEQNTIYSKIIKYLPTFFIPAYILQLISLGLRINQYGLTFERYIGILIIIFETIYIIYYIFDYIFEYNKIKLEYIFLFSSLMILISFFVPKINVYEFPKIYNNFFDKNIEETNFINNKVKERDRYKYKVFESDEIIVKGYDKIKKFNITCFYEDLYKKEYLDNYTNKMYDSKMINFEEIIDKIKMGIKTNPSDPLLDINNIFFTNNNKIIIQHININYNDIDSKINRIGLSGYILIKE